MNKYNLALGAFIAVISCTSYLFGFFSAAYVGELSDKEQNEVMGKLTSQYQDVINFAKDNELFETYQFYYSELISISSLSKLENPPLRLIINKKEQLKDVIPSLECMLSNFRDPEMRETAQKRINEIKEAINEST